MTATVRSADALFGRQVNWKSINWKQVRGAVRRLQVRIAKAVRMAWMFSSKVKDKRGIPRLYEVIRSSHIGIVRHRKIKGNANPFDPEYFEYFRKRRFLKTYGHGARLAESFV